mgnify:CR=1 FL=1
MKLIRDIRKVVYIEENKLKRSSKIILFIVVLIFPITFYLMAKVQIFNCIEIDRLIKFGIIIFVLPILVFIALTIISKIEYK